MPTYDYRCPKCGKFTISQRITEKALVECPTCSSPVSRLIGRNVNIIYKCSGFYCTDTSSSSGASSETKKEIGETGCDCKQAENKDSNVQRNSTGENKVGESKTAETKLAETKTTQTKAGESKTESRPTKSKSA